DKDDDLQLDAEELYTNVNPPKESEEPVDPNTSVPDSIPRYKIVAAGDKQDPVFKELVSDINARVYSGNMPPNLEFHNDTLYYRHPMTNLCALYEPECKVPGMGKVRTYIMRMYHEELGHQNGRLLADRIRQSYYW